MHGAMGGWHEIRLTGPGREQFRLFCLLENGTSQELARRGPRRLVPTTAKPAWPSALAASCPIPEDVPVTSATGCWVVIAASHLLEFRFTCAVVIVARLPSPPVATLCDSACGAVG